MPGRADRAEGGRRLALLERLDRAEPRPRRQQRRVDQEAGTTIVSASSSPPPSAQNRSSASTSSGRWTRTSSSRVAGRGARRSRAPSRPALSAPRRTERRRAARSGCQEPVSCSSRRSWVNRRTGATSRTLLVADPGRDRRRDLRRPGRGGLGRFDRRVELLEGEPTCGRRVDAARAPRPPRRRRPRRPPRPSASRRASTVRERPSRPTMTSSSWVHIGNASGSTSPSMTAQLSTRRYASARRAWTRVSTTGGGVAARHDAAMLRRRVAQGDGPGTGHASVMAPFSAPWASRAYLASTPLV